MCVCVCGTIWPMIICKEVSSSGASRMMSTGAKSCHIFIDGVGGREIFQYCLKSDYKFYYAFFNIADETK